MSTTPTTTVPQSVATPPPAKLNTPDPNDKTADKIVRARVKMLMNQPFFGQLALRLILVEADDSWCKTAATDGKHLYYNKKFIEKMDLPETIFVVAHEVMHCVYDHMTRRGGRDPHLWNVAGDFVINLELADQRVGKVPKLASPLYDEKYRGLSTDEVYEKLLKDGKGKGYQTLDQHVQIGADGDGQSGGNNPDPTGRTGPVPLTDEERKSLADEIRHSTMEAAKNAGAGNCPAGVQRLLKDLTEPEMDWRQIINLHIQSLVKSDFTFARQSRKSMSSGFYLPGMKEEEMIKVGIAIDLSGSIGNEQAKDFMSEIKGIMDQFADFELTIWCFDTQVYNPQKFTPDNMDDFLEYELKGGGGTMFECNWDWMKQEEFQPEKFIMFTDGYPCGTWGDEAYCDTVFVVHTGLTGGHKPVAPFGTTAYYEKNGG